MQLLLLDRELTVCRLTSDSPLPEWLPNQGFFSITRTDDELSIVMESSLCPNTFQQETGWKALKVEGPLDFSLTGILFSLAKPLAETGISIFAISTFDTDYLLVKSNTLEHAIAIYAEKGI